MEEDIVNHNENDLRSKIYMIRGKQVMLDFDLAEIYGYETKNFNRQVKNNIEKFDEDFMFQLSDVEVEHLSRCKIFTLNTGRGSNIKYKPYAFTEQGIYMLMTVLRGDLAIKQSKILIRLFKAMKDYIIEREHLVGYDDVAKLALQTSQNTKDIAEIKEYIRGFSPAEIQKDLLSLNGKTVEADKDQPKLDIESKILVIRSRQVMIDRDLAELYGVETKRLNEQVRRNIERFPKDFCFQLNNDETKELVAFCDRFASMKHSTVNPYAFTEQGIAMLSSVLRSPNAVEVNIQIMRAFIAMRRFMQTNAQVFQRLDRVEKHQLDSDRKIDELFAKMDRYKIEDKQGIFFNGQIFDAYTFVCDLIRSAKKQIILFDNYIDDSVLKMLDKHGDGVNVRILTKSISSQLQLDIEKHNSQYSPIKLEVFTNSHDRFLFIDDTVYHIGASLKDLGKKWFGFSKMEIDTESLMKKL